jgi:hypothetical protein
MRYPLIVDCLKRLKHVINDMEKPRIDSSRYHALRTIWG